MATDKTEVVIVRSDNILDWNIEHVFFIDEFEFDDDGHFETMWMVE